MEEEKYLKIKQNTGKILYYLLLSGGVVALLVLAPTLPYAILKNYLKEKNKKFAKSRFNRDLKRLEQRGEVRISKNAVTITKQGKSRVLKYQLNDLKIPIPKRWDKKWRLVIFDIPEDDKNARNSLRDKLNELGFRHYQKSVLIYPYECRDVVDYIKEIYEVSPYVKLVTATQIDDEERFRRKFQLI